MPESKTGMWGRQIGSLLGSMLAGPGGAVVGNLAGWLLDLVIPNANAADIIKNVLTEETTAAVQKTGKQLIEKLDPSEKVKINRDLQRIFRQAFQEAVYDLGGKVCFPKIWAEKPRDVTSGVVYLSTPEGYALWRDKNPLAQQICVFFQELLEWLKTERILPVSPTKEQSMEDVQSYLDVELNWEMNQLFNDTVLVQFFNQHASLLAERSDFKRHIEQHLLDRTLLHLGDILKVDTQAWRAFNRLLLEGLKSEAKDLSSGQKEVLERLDLLLDKDNPTPLAQWSEGIATLITSVGNLEKHLDGRFNIVLAQAVAQHGEVLARIDSLMVVGGRIETKVDRVLKFFEDGRYVMEGAATDAGIRATNLTLCLPSDTSPIEGEKLRDLAIARDILEFLFQARSTTEYVSFDSTVKRLKLPRKSITRILDYLEADKAIQSIRKRSHGSLLEYYYAITDNGVKLLYQMKL